ncbi:glycosyltransferase family 2 protein [Psychrobacter arenosus]|uniref:glycosyltransferase family 2 protein n=1 Tax=Psychrobacter arenosus TaxID=256326 RepID=UPI00191910AA|nr:glycosyltransferase [Psychrobacter arenosus]
MSFTPHSPNLNTTVKGEATKPTVPVSVITTCYGRNRHLYNLLTSLAAGSVSPAQVILVNDDADQTKLASFGLNIMQLPTTAHTQSQAGTATKAAVETGFDIGRNRNVGADQASFETLIFLDVDCVVAEDFIAGIAAKLDQHPNALLMGQPRYLTRPLSTEESTLLADAEQATPMLAALSVLNPYRHNLAGDEPAIKPTQDYGAFWSLCFAITKTQFNHIGGFDTDYVGYGAEDTDFAFMARALDIPFYLTKDTIYHQQHSVSRPPLNHLSSIVINANRFYDKWQHWPMGGWLEQFAEMGLIDWEPIKKDAIVLTRMPTKQEVEAAHCADAPYV